MKQSKDFHGFTFTSSLVGVSMLLNYISLYCHEISNYVIMTEQHELALTIQGVYFVEINSMNFVFQKDYAQKTNNLYGLHLILDWFVNFNPAKYAPYTVILFAIYTFRMHTCVRILSPTYTRQHFAGNTVESNLLLSVCWASTLKATCCLTTLPDVESNIMLPVVYVGL